MPKLSTSEGSYFSQVDASKGKNGRSGDNKR